MKTSYPTKSITDVVMLYGASNAQLGSDPMKNNYPNLNLMSGVEHTLSLFFNDISKLPFVNQMIIYHKALLPVVGNHGKLGPCPRPWRGGGTTHMITVLCRLRASSGGLRAWHRKGEGGYGTGP